MTTTSKATTKTTSKESPVKGSRKPAQRRPALEPAGVAEIATAFGVAADTVQKWRLRFTPELADHPFPEARGTIGGNPWWHLGDVIRWAKRTGREVPR